MTTDEMLEQIVTLLCFDGLWHARRRGSPVFSTAATPQDALRLALDGPADEPNDDLF